MRSNLVRHGKWIALLLCIVQLPACDRDVPVLTGIDVLSRDNFAALSGQRIALITNQTGVDRHGKSTIRILHDAEAVDLVRIFSPEHGLEGKLDIPVVGDGTESDTGISVFSLYGDTRRPTPAMLDEIDTVVFDIQDIGTRFYTYISTMGNAMQAASELGVRFVVLDRPNPINGTTVAGPVLDDGKQSFVGFHRIPIRHGMTVGELALLFKDELAIDIELQVVKLEGWQRAQFFDATDLPWINPSPNMRSLTEAILYPGIGILETTNLSVGRGTDTPFEVIGAPWLDGVALAAQLGELELPGISFGPLEFTPDSSKFSGEQCSGLRMTITDREQFEPVRTGLEIAHLLMRNYPDTWEADAYLRLLGNDAAHRAVIDGRPYAEIFAAYIDGLNDFRDRRARFLLYR